MIDIGSTTCDLIPLVDGQPVTIGKTDPNRMINGELIYTGVQRAPVCAVAQLVPWRGRKCPLAHEVFATMWDVYLTLGDLPEEPIEHAHGRPPPGHEGGRPRSAGPLDLRRPRNVQRGRRAR